METDKIIRILIANRPRLMRDLILSTISEHVGIKVVGEVEDECDVGKNVARIRPDCLIIALDQPGQRPALCDALLRDFPEMKILGVSATDNSSMLFWASLEFRSRRVEASEEGLLGVLHEFANAEIAKESKSSEVLEPVGR